jgi:hypothetical protein
MTLTRAEAGLMPRYRGVDLALKLDRWAELSEAHDWWTDNIWARQLGVEATSVWRLRTGRIGPSSRMLAALLDLLPDTDVRGIFNIVSSGGEPCPTCRR